MPPFGPLAVPVSIPAPESWPESDRLEDWELLPMRPDWASGLRQEWTPGEEGALARLDAFLGHASLYEERRNLPSLEGTSRLSPHLHFGEISPASVWHALADLNTSAGPFLGELGWRDYAENVIFQLPDYGIVDAGMRQLWATGWMHNRVRMLAASFLIKHLLIDWREGERWFWDTLVDADYASNAVNWQWSAGSGVDANLFVRIMAPLSQSEKFDAAAYIRQWVPELAGLPDREIHDPPPEKRPGTYPEMLIGHRFARERALAAHAKMKAGASKTLREES